MAKRNGKISDFIQDGPAATRYVGAEIPTDLFENMVEKMKTRPKKLSWQKFIEASCHAFLAESNDKTR